MAPVQGGRQRPLAGVGGRVAPREQAKTGVQARRQLGRGQHHHLARRQLQGQGQPVQAGADLDHGRGVLVRQGEGGPHVAGPLHEQAHRPVPQEGRRLRQGGRGQGLAGRAGGPGQGGHPPGGLPRQAQGPPAGGQHAHAGAGPQQGLRQRPAGAQEVLAVVQHEQQAPGAQGPAQGIRQGPLGDLRHPGGGGDRLGHQLRVGQGRQLRQPHPVRVRRLVLSGPPRAAREAGGEGQSQAGLAAPAGAGQRQQAGLGQAPGDRRQLPLPPHQRRQGRRQVVPRG